MKRTLTHVALGMAVLGVVLGAVYIRFPLEKSPRFRHFVIDADTPARLAVADVDGDGQLDVFTAVDFESDKPTGLYWYAYPGWIRHTVSAGVNFRADDMECGDIDGDGDPDMVVTVDEDGKVYWYENPRPAGDPRIPEWRAHLVGISGGYVKDVEVEDLDGDGRLEIVTRMHEKVSVFTGGPGGYWRAIEIAVPPKEGMDVGDLDGDGDLDVVLNGFWLETPDNLIQGLWQRHVIDTKWYSQREGVWQDNCANVVVADLNRDGRNDVILCHSEKTGWPISWYERNGTFWTEHSIARRFEYCETLAVADMDVDGDLDVVAGGMKKSFNSGDLTLFLNDGAAVEWIAEKVFHRIGIYNAVVADIGGDGDPDIIDCRDYNKPPLEWWENQTSNDWDWIYHSVDAHRPKSQFGKMGLTFADVNHDSFQDIVAGSFVYINPEGVLSRKWTRVALPHDSDVYFAHDIDGDEFADLVGIGGAELLWLEAANRRGSDWHAYTIASVPEGRTQGYLSAQIIPGGNPELVFTRGKSLYYLVIPTHDPENGFWPLIQISVENEEEGVAAGDIDQDGDIDLATISVEGHHIIWLEDPGASGRGLWARHMIGESTQWSDRVALADVNRDGRLDVITTEETQNRHYTANVFWFEAPLTPKTELWKRHTIATLRSVNSLDVADLDSDGYIDLVVAEHTDQRSERGAPDNLTVLYQNREKGSLWSPVIVERNGHSSHLGARLCDLDNDGDLDIVSIAWRQYRYVHLWENTAGKEVFGYSSVRLTGDRH